MMNTNEHLQTHAPSTSSRSARANVAAYVSQVGSVRSAIAFLLAVIMVFSLITPRLSWADGEDSTSGPAVETDSTNPAIAAQGAPITALDAFAPWTVTANLTPPNPGPAYNSGETIKVDVNFQRSQGGAVDYDQEYVLYINAAITQLPVFSGVQSINGKPVLIVKSQGTENVGGTPYIKYVYAFNPDLTETDLSSLFSTKFSASVTLKTVSSETTINKPIITNDSSEVEIGQITIKPPAPPASSGSVNLQKNVATIYNYENGRYIEDSGNTGYVTTGSLVKFNVTISDNLKYYTENGIAYPIYKLLEQVPAGYTGVTKGAQLPIGPSGNTAVNAQWTHNPINSTNPEMWDYDLSYYTATQSSLTVAFYAIVQPGADTSKLINKVTAHPDNGDKDKNATAGVAVGTKPTPPPVIPPEPGDYYDLALITYMGEHGHRNQSGGTLTHDKVFTELNQKQDFKIAIYNQGWKDVDNVTIAINLPENIQMLDKDGNIADPEVGDILPNGWVYRGSPTPVPNANNWTPVKQYTKLISSGRDGDEDYTNYLRARQPYDHYGWCWAGITFSAIITGDYDSDNLTVPELGTRLYSAEIVSFEGYNTTYTTKTAMVNNVPTVVNDEEVSPGTADGITNHPDEDSFPDSNPYNDLSRHPIAQNDYNTTFLGFDANEAANGAINWKYENLNPINGEPLAKEYAGRFNEKTTAPGNGAWQADEDDYDFVQIRVREPKPNIDYTLDELNKSRVSIEEIKKGTALASQNTVINSFTGNSFTGNSKSGYKMGNYTYIGDDGAITNPLTFFVYKVTVNAGEHDMSNVTLTDTLPDGLKYITLAEMGLTSGTYGANGPFSSYKNNYGFFSEFYWKASTLKDGSKAVVPNDSNIHTSTTSSDADAGDYYANIGSANTIGFPKIPGYGTQRDNNNYNYNKLTSGEGISWVNPDAHPVDTEKYFENFKVDFTSNHEVTVTAKNLHETLVDLYFFVALDPSKPLQEGTVYQNSATMTRDGADEIIVTEDTYAYWDYDGASAFAKKFINTSAKGSAKWKGTEGLKIVGEEATIPYRIQVRAIGSNANGGTFTANPPQIHIDDYLKSQAAGAGATINDVKVNNTSILDSGVIPVSTYTGSAFTTTGLGNKITNESSMSAIYASESGILTISNNQDITPGSEGRIYDVEFAVDYADITPGTAIKNTAGNTVTSVRPLSFDLHKTNFAGGPLEGAEFNLYYADAKGVVNYSDPVKNTGSTQEIQDDPTKATVVTLGAFNNYHFTFVPKDYQAKNSWHIAFVETVAPHKNPDYEPPYEAGHIYYMDITKDSGGNLTWSISTANGGYILTTTAGLGHYDFLNTNEEITTTKMALTKTWLGDTPNGTPLFYYISSTDTSRHENPFTKTAEGWISGNIYTGLYSIVEYSPIGYGPEAIDNWTYLGRATKAGIAYDKYESKFGVALDKDGKVTIQGAVSDSVNVTNTAIGDYGLEKLWPAGWPGYEDANRVSTDGITILDPTVAPPTTKFFLVGANGRYELSKATEDYTTIGGLRYTNNYIKAGTYDLYEYSTAEDYVPTVFIDSDGSTISGAWTLQPEDAVDYPGYKIYKHSSSITVAPRTGDAPYKSVEKRVSLPAIVNTSGSILPVYDTLTIRKVLTGAAVENGATTTSPYAVKVRVSGSAVDDSEYLTFTGDAPNYVFSGSGVTSDAATSLTISQAAPVFITGLPAGSEYVVSEGITGDYIPTITYGAIGDVDTGITHSAVVTNDYVTPTPVAVTLAAVKTVTGTGATLDANQFAFELYDSNADGEIGATPIETVSNGAVFADGSAYVTFSSITYGGINPAVHYYLIKEKSAADTGDWIYSNKTYLAVVSVSAVQVGQSNQKILRAETTYKEKNGEGDWVNVAGGKLVNGFPEIINRYSVPAPIEVDFDVTKTATGAALNAGAFTFGVFSVNTKSAVLGTQVATASNIAAPAGQASPVTFAGIEIANAGTYYYIIKETNPDTTPITSSGWRLDKTQYFATVVVEEEHVNGAIPDGDDILTTTSISYQVSTDGGSTWNDFHPNTSLKNFTNTYVEYDAALRKWVSGDYRIKSDGTIVSIPAIGEPTSPASAVPVTKGDVVKYTIKVYNQGNQATKIPQIVDYLPTDGALSFTKAAVFAGQYPEIFTNAGWTYDESTYKLTYNYDKTYAGWGTATDTVIASGAATYTGNADVTLAPGAAKEISVYLVVNSAPANGTIDNFAEISEFTDDEGTEVEDIDSTPDTDEDNDNFIDEDDNEIDENAKENPGDDEDDHDIAQITVAELGDLVISKHVLNNAGDNHKFSFKVSDENGPVNLTAEKIDIVWEPTLAFAQDGLAQGIVTLTDGAIVKIGGLTPGAYTVEEVSVSGLALGAYETAYETSTGVPAVPSTGAGVTVSGVDVTSAAIREVNFTNTFKKYDAALKKWVSDVDRPTGYDANSNSYTVTDVKGYGEPANAAKVTPAAVRIGDLVTYKIGLYNQGAYDVTIKEVVDNLPDGLAFVEAGTLVSGVAVNTNWALGDTAKGQNANQLYWTSESGIQLLANPDHKATDKPSDYPAGTSDSITVVLKVVATESGTITNTAEIVKLYDGTGEYPVEDIDSTPDDDTDNDDTVDNEIEDDGKPDDDEDETVDEDDSDIAEIDLRVYDVALRKWIPSVERKVTGAKDWANVYSAKTPEYNTAVPVQIGDKVTFAIDLFNQCTNDVQISKISDYIGNGFTYVAADNDTAWNYNSASGIAAYAGNPLALEQWSGKAADAYPATTVSITLRVAKITGASVGTERYNYAEITELQDEDGDVVPDYDSVPDGDLHNDGELNDDTRVPTDSGLNPIKDNVITEHALEPDGSKVINESPENPNGYGYDEDDHDFAKVKDVEYDAALKKWVESVEHAGKSTEIDKSGENGPTGNTSPASVSVGDFVSYSIRVFNQTELPINITEVVDYVPKGLGFVASKNPDWTYNKDTGKATYVGEPIKLSGNTSQNEDGTYNYSDNAGTAKTLTLVLEVLSSSSEGIASAPIRNSAEISGITDDNDNPVEDKDSTPDDEDNENPKDNEIDEDGKDGGDEDDHDYAEVIVKKYDAALRKWIESVDHAGNNTPVETAVNGPTGKVTPTKVLVGDLVHYNIRVFNQSALPLDIAEITDYVPAGLEFVAAENPGWKYDAKTRKATYSEANGAKDMPIKLHANTTQKADGTFAYNDAADVATAKTVKLVLKVLSPDKSLTSNGQTSVNVINFAEISQLTDEEGTPVKDIDSKPDSDLDNDGKIDDKDKPVQDNEIDEHGKKEDGTENRGKDEDDHDYAEIVIPVHISVEVDKDTIKRTTAAYESLPDKEGFNNVGEEDERYKYEIDFRSTSTVDAEEFIVDDPLENVKAGLIRVEELYTPIVWGDLDGKYNVWYKTNLQSASDLTNYGGSLTATPELGAPNSGLRSYSNAGFKPWIEKAAGGQNATQIDPTKRYKLDVSKLGLADGEYITAIRFEYGAVAVGFTSKNYSDRSINGEHRDNDGNVDLPRDNTGKIETLTVNPAPATKLSSSPISLRTSKELRYLKAANDSLNGTVADIAQMAGIGAESSGSGAVATFATGINANEVNWTPDGSNDFYAQGAVDATGLKPAAYLVSATRAMSDVDIVSSVTARIARAGERDADQDAVVTNEIQTFATDPESLEIDKAVIEENSFVKNGEDAGLITRGGTDAPPELTDKGKENLTKDGKAAKANVVNGQTFKEGATVTNPVSLIRAAITGDEFDATILLITMLGAAAVMTMLILLQAQRIRRRKYADKREDV
ncbi:MAG: DUF11 domain-containing protein [Clostridiales Family XIII bacterium]|jgi:uncharacterized repeat protein (TIGR01451 family)|nr:DUF11 domain-containing protein [Clostridiales Family XIII bacterium]